MLERGAFDHAIIILGTPGTGKSTYAIELLQKLGRTPAYKIMHDPGWRVPNRTASGRAVDIIRHASIAEGAAAIATKPGAVHSFAEADGLSVLQFSEHVAATSLEKHGGMKGTPVILLLDEGVATAAASPHRLAKEMRQFLAGRRHKNVGLIMTAQDPRYIHYSFMGLSTEMVCFRISDEDSIRRIKKLGFPEASRLQSLPKYQFLTHKLS